MHPYKTNRLKQAIANGGVGVIANGFNTPEMCDFLGQFGFDACFIDYEHGSPSIAALGDITRACDLWGMTAMVRVGRLDEAQILRALDQGAESIVVPHVITAADARRAAAACRYPPAGVRGVAGSRRQYGVENYFASADEQVQCIALIEDIEAVDNIADLLPVDGVDVWYVAPSDLAASMGHVGNPEHPDAVAARDRAIDAIVGAGKVAGTLVNDASVGRYLERGVRCIGVPWPAWVAAGAKAFFDRVPGRG